MNEVQRNDDNKLQTSRPNIDSGKWPQKSEEARGNRFQYKTTVKTFARRMTREERRIAKLECSTARYDGHDVETRPKHILARAIQLS